MVERCQAGRCCTMMMMHIAWFLLPILLAEVTHDYSKLVAIRPRSLVWEYAVESSEPVLETALIRLVSRNKS